MIEKEYSEDVCNEVAELLDHVPKDLYDKLPNDVINYFYQNSDESTKRFEYNVALPILEQDISQETKAIIEEFFNTYWR